MFGVLAALLITKLVGLTSQECGLKLQPELSTVHLVKGNNFTIVCDASCYSPLPPNQITWFDHDNNKISHSERIPPVSYNRRMYIRLIILNVGLQHAGRYTCTGVVNETVVRREIIINVTEESVHGHRAEDLPKRRDVRVPDMRLPQRRPRRDAGSQGDSTRDTIDESSSEHTDTTSLSVTAITPTPTTNGPSTSTTKGPITPIPTTPNMDGPSTSRTKAPITPTTDGPSTLTTKAPITPTPIPTTDGPSTSTTNAPITPTPIPNTDGPSTPTTKAPITPTPTLTTPNTDGPSTSTTKAPITHTPIPNTDGPSTSTIKGPITPNTDGQSTSTSKRPTTTFGKHGLLAFSLSLSAALLLLYTLIAINICIPSCFKKQQSVNFQKEHATVDFIAMKPLQDEQQPNKPDSQGFITIDLDDKNEGAGTNTSKVSENETGASTSPSEAQSPSKFNSTFVIGKDTSTACADNTGQNGEKVQGQNGEKVQADKTGQDVEKGHQNAGDKANDKAYSEADEKAAQAFLETHFEFHKTDKVQAEGTSKKVNKEADEVNKVADNEVEKKVNMKGDERPHKTLDIKASSTSNLDQEP